MLTDDAIAQIAHEARTLPAAEVGRYVFPLVRHIAALEERTCQGCRWWVPYNHAEAHQWECLRPAGNGTPVRIQVVMRPDGLAEAHSALLTAFDFGCRAWEQRPADDGAGQCQASGG